jgi:Carboxypeptidase regulatory-like domain
MRLAGILVVVLLAVGTAAVAQAPSDWVTVTGTVVDSENRPAEAAKITVFPMEVAISGGLPYATTDAEGKFRLSSPAFGRTRFCAVKEAAGYPDTQLLLFVSATQIADTMPEVLLTPGARVSVNIRLPEPDGVIVGIVTDAVTKLPVRTARIRLDRHDRVTAMHSTTLDPSGRFTYALPDAPIEVTITAPGYKPWSYVDSNGAKALRLSAGEHRNLDIELVPVPPQSPLSTVTIHDWHQSWWLGSLRTGSGVEVQTTMQFFQDHGVHLNIVSPLR